MVVLFLCACTTGSQQSTVPNAHGVQEVDSLSRLSFKSLETNMPEAIEYARLALRKAKTINYRKGESDAHIRIANGLLQQEAFAESVRHYDSCIAIRSELNNEVDLARAYSGMGNALIAYAEVSLLKRSQHLARAEKYYREARSVYKKRNNQEELGKNSIHLGLLAIGQANRNKAFQFLKEALAIGLEQNDSMLVGRSCANLGSLFNEIEEYDSALHWSAVSSLYICKSCNELQLLNYINKGLAHFMMEQDDSAVLYYRRAETIMETNGFNSYERTVYGNLRDFYDFHDSLEHFRTYGTAYVELMDSLLSANRLKYSAIATEEFYTQDIENKNTLLELESRHKTRNQIVLAVLLLLTGLVASVFIRNQRHRRRLAEQQIDLSNQKIDNLLQTQEMKNIDAMLEGQEAERKRIAADLHDRLGSMLSAVKLHFTAVQDKLTDLEKENRKQYDKANELLDFAAEEVRKIARNMETGTLAKFGLVPALYELKNTLEASGKIRINVYEKGLDQRLDYGVEIEVYRIVQEALSNVLKHAEASKIDLNITQIEHELTLVVEDNGVGFDAERTHYGLGIKNIKQRVEKLRGQVNLDTMPGRGTTLIAEIPLKKETNR